MLFKIDQLCLVHTNRIHRLANTSFMATGNLYALNYLVYRTLGMPDSDAVKDHQSIRMILNITILKIIMFKSLAI